MADRGQLRIGVDGYNLAMARGTGVATYGRTLCAAITALGHPLDLFYGLTVSAKVRTELRESLFFARLGDDEASAPSPKATLRRAVRRAFTLPFARDMVAVPVNGRVVTTDFADRMPAFNRLFTLGSLFSVSARHFRRYGRFMTVRVPDPPAIMHWTYPVPIRLEGAANIYTIHDLVPMRLPHTSLEDKSYYDALIRRCVADADHIVTVSESSRRDIVDLFPIQPARLSNTGQPFDIPLDEEEGTEVLERRLRRLFDLQRGGYFLFFGAIEPKKNVGRLIEAYLSADVETPLVIVGAGGWHSDRELRMLNGEHGRRLEGASRIRQFDYLPRRMLMELVRGARAVVFPSLYEGFGLPALEALALGVPLIASSGGALPEIVGNAALQVDPYDVAALTQAIRQMDSDAALRARLAVEGPAQSAQFSVERYREKVERLYRSVGASIKLSPI